MSIFTVNIFLFLSILIIKIVSSWNPEAGHYSLYQVTAFNYHERRTLYDIHFKDDNIIFLNGVTNDAALPMDIVVNECCTEGFEIHLQDKYIEYINIGRDQIQEEFNSLNMSSQQKIDQTIVPNASANFLDWNQILQWVDNRCKRFSTLQKVTIGKTYEKREMLLLKLSTGGKKPAAFIMGGEQGKDWISTAIVLNYIDNLLQAPNNVLLKSFEFYFLPVFNPDGYEFSMKHDRFWNKNRKSFFPLKRCPTKAIAVGVNIERNWFLTRTSTVPDAECNSVYMGHRCLTEEETKSLSSFLNSIAVNLLAFINLRGFANLVTVPFAESDKYANNQAILMEMLLFACKKVKKVYNVTYKFSNTASCFFNLSGNGADWVKSRLNVPIVYTVYMKQEPFILPHSEHIIPLTAHFSLMAQEMLVLGSSFYGPLFSIQTPLCSNICLIIGCIFITI